MFDKNPSIFKNAFVFAKTAVRAFTIFTKNCDDSENDLANAVF